MRLALGLWCIPISAKKFVWRQLGVRIFVRQLRLAHFLFAQKITCRGQTRKGKDIMKKIYFGVLILFLVVNSLLLSSCVNVECKHKITVEDWRISPTCTEKGEGIVKCRECNTILSTFEIPPRGHSYEEEWVTIEPTCTEKGYTVYRCARYYSCDSYIESDFVEPIGHTEVIIPGYESTCYYSGLTDGKMCSVCDKMLVHQETAPLAAHTYENDEDNICNVCDYQRFCKHYNTEILPSQEPTCISIGLTQGEQCLDCYEILVAQHVINTLEHNYRNLTVINPTCESKGYSVYVCDCGEEGINKFNYVEELGHNYGMWYIYKDDTTAIEGEGRRDCLNGDCDKYLSHSVSTGLSYEIEYNSCRITGIGDCVDSEIFIPASIDGYSVSIIEEDAFKNCTTITGVYIPDSVCIIAKGAFNGCSSLESMTLPFVGGSVYAKEASESTLFGYIFGSEKYDGGIFAEQYFMSNLNGEYNNAYCSRNYCIPSSLKNITVTGGKIFYGAFYDCDSLVDVTIPYAAPAVCYDCDSLVNVTINYSSVADYAFYDCDSLVNVIINDDFSYSSYIGKYAFYSCNSLRVFSSDAVGSIFEHAFEYCTSLMYVICPNVHDYRSYAFKNCSSLISVTFGDLMFNTIVQDTFQYCYGLIEVRHKSHLSMDSIVPGSSSLGGIAYYAKDVITDDSKSNLKIVGDYIFYDNGTEIYLVRYLGEEEEITLPEYEGGKEYAIWSSAFSWNKTIKSVIIPDCVTSIEQSAFSCSSIENVEIGDSVEFIYMSAFENTRIKNIFIPISVKYMGSLVFGGCDGIVIYCEANSDAGWQTWWNAIYNNSTKYLEATVYYNQSRK